MLKLAIIPLIGLGVFFAYAQEPIPITYSGTMDRVIFDGKWTFEQEWKQSSLDTYLYEDGNKMVVLRSAHQDDHVYIFIDVVTDESLDSKSDYATICFDSENNKSMNPDHDDRCFTATLAGDMGVALQGGSNSGFEQMENHPDFIAIGGISDKNDRYSAVPHTGYEFRIPTDVIGRNNVYGFYFLVYDDQAKKYYSYPTDLIYNDVISSPSVWGEIYSPDKSLPEFSLPLLILLPVFGLVIILSKNHKCKF